MTARLPIELAYERWQSGEITEAEYRRDYAAPDEARRQDMRRARVRAFLPHITRSA